MHFSFLTFLVFLQFLTVRNFMSSSRHAFDQLSPNSGTTDTRHACILSVLCRSLFKVRCSKFDVQCSTFAGLASRCLASNRPGRNRSFNASFTFQSAPVNSHKVTLSHAKSGKVHQNKILCATLTNPIQPGIMIWLNHSVDYNVRPK
jgi:hypothetical protein